MSRAALASLVASALLLAAPDAVAQSARQRTARRTPRVPSCTTFVSRVAARRRLTPAAAQLVRRSFERHGGEVVRWTPRPDSAAGIRVWVPLAAHTRERALRDNTSDAGGAYDEALWSAVVTALDDWSGIVRGVRFDLARDSTEADVAVVWVSHIATPGAPDAPWTAGRSGVERRRSTGEITSAFLLLALLDQRERPVTARDVHAVAVHEVGHLLGLSHSPAPEGASAMTARVTGAEVSAADSASLRAWYSLPTGRACTPAPRR